jgi:hypothetical protein
MEWQPIETAPKDATKIAFKNTKNGLYDKGYWCDYRGHAMTGIAGEWNTVYGNGDMTHWRNLVDNVET